MKIATFNANSIRSRLHVVLPWLKKHQPDVLCLQETKVVDDLFPSTDFTDIGYHPVFRGQKAYNGVALISKTPATRVSFGIDDAGAVDDSRLVCARVAGVWVVNTYVPQGREIDNPMYKYKLQWFRRLKALFERRFGPRTRIAWVGDLNVVDPYIRLFGQPVNPQTRYDFTVFGAYFAYTLVLSILHLRGII